MGFTAAALRRRLAIVVLLAGLTTVPARASFQAPPILVEHPWKQTLEYWEAVEELSGPENGKARLAVAEKILLAEGSRYTRSFFAQRGGTAEVGLSYWVDLPAEAFAAIAEKLADENVQQMIEAGAAEMVDRLHGIPGSADTVAFVFVVGGFQSYFTSYTDGGTNVIAIHLEAFVPLPGDLSPQVMREIDRSIRWRPDRLATLDDLFPWCVYGYTQVFLPELRRRMIDDNATLAEYAILNGFSAQLAGALYPESVFAGGAAPVGTAVSARIEPAWRQIGESWFDLGNEPFPMVLLDERLRAPVPEGTTAQQAIAVIGTHLAEEWLNGTRHTREPDRATEISQLGRLPTMFVWELIEAY
jgi:hypothetical protein